MRGYVTSSASHMGVTPRQAWPLSIARVQRHGVRGYDGGKRLSGRKRHVLVDTMGLLLKVVVHPANLHDRQGGRLLVEAVRGQVRTLNMCGKGTRANSGGGRAKNSTLSWKLYIHGGASSNGMFQNCSNTLEVTKVFRSSRGAGLLNGRCARRAPAGAQSPPRER